MSEQPPGSGRGADEAAAGQQPAATTEPTYSPDGLIDALHVKRNVAIAAAVGVLVSGLLYAGRIMEVLGPAPTRGSPLLFLGLAVVLASAITGFIGFLLIVGSAIRLARATAREDARPTAHEETDADPETDDH